MMRARAGEKVTLYLKYFAKSEKKECSLKCCFRAFRGYTNLRICGNIVENYQNKRHSIFLNPKNRVGFLRDAVERMLKTQKMRQQSLKIKLFFQKNTVIKEIKTSCSVEMSLFKKSCHSIFQKNNVMFFIVFGQNSAWMATNRVENYPKTSKNPLFCTNLVK